MFCFCSNIFDRLRPYQEINVVKIVDTVFVHNILVRMYMYVVYLMHLSTNLYPFFFFVFSLHNSLCIIGSSYSLFLLCFKMFGTIQFKFLEESFAIRFFFLSRSTLVVFIPKNLPLVDLKFNESFHSPCHNYVLVVSSYSSSKMNLLFSLRLANQKHDKTNIYR